MFLKQEIQTLFRNHNPRKSKYSERDLQIILEYFGFGEEKFPTQELLGQTYNIRKQYISNDIIKTKFKNKVQIEELPILLNISEVLQEAIKEHRYIFYSDLLLLFIEKNLIDDFVSLKGLLNLLECFKLVTNLDIYTMNMVKATKKDILRDDEFFVAKKKYQNKLGKDIQGILKFPGRIIGICCLDDVYEKEKVTTQPCYQTSRWLRKMG